MSAAPDDLRPRPRRWLRPSLAAASIAIVAVGSAAAGWIASLGPPPLGQGLTFSTLVVDRDGEVLRAYLTPEGRWRLPATRDSVDPRFLALLLAYEDKRFFAHRGIDPLATATLKRSGFGLSTATIGNV